jgi:hypothetical protein
MEEDKSVESVTTSVSELAVEQTTEQVTDSVVESVAESSKQLIEQELPEQQKVHVLTRQAILEEAKKQNYDLTDELLDTPMKEGMVALLLFPDFEKIILPFPTYTVKFNPSQDLIKINIPKVSDGVSNISICFSENILKADFEIVSKNEEGAYVSLFKETLVKEQLLESGVEYGNWIAFPKTFNTILDIVELKEETPFVITLYITPRDEEQEEEVAFERIYYKRV